MDFFFYGTLMDADVLRAVLGRSLPPDALSPAALDGYRRCAIRGRSYPMLMPDRSGTVRGLVALGLGEADALRLSWYESDGYGAGPCWPRLADGSRVRAWIFLPGPDEMAPGGAWSLDIWRRRHKAVCLGALARERAAGEPSAAALAEARVAWERRRRA